MPPVSGVPTEHGALGQVLGDCKEEGDLFGASNMSSRSSLEAGCKCRPLHSLLWVLKSTPGLQCLLGSFWGSRSPRQQEAGRRVWGGRSHRKLRESLAPVRAVVESC